MKYNKVEARYGWRIFTMGTVVIVRPISARKDEFMKRGRIPRGDKF